MDTSIRNATAADAARLAELVSALGYATTAAQMERRLAAILRDGDYISLVACNGDDVVGFIGARVGPLYEADGSYGQIMALAVAADRRRRGIGGLLVRAAEAALTGREVCVLIVTSGNHRTDAHAFYETLGYEWTGRRYKKAATL